MRVLYFGTYERDYPRNAQVISCLRRAGVEVRERHEPVWDGRRDSWRAGVGDAARLALAEARLLRAPQERFDAVIVGYPGHFDLPAARRAAGGAPVVFNPLVSLADTFVDDRGRFRPGVGLRTFGTSGKAQRVIPNKAFQALACGTPLVTADTPAARELLADGENALLVPPGDAEALANALRRLVAEPALAQRLSEGALAAYRQHASEDVL